MRENRTCSSEGGEALRLPYPYKQSRTIQLLFEVPLGRQSVLLRGVPRGLAEAKRVSTITFCLVQRFVCALDQFVRFFTVLRERGDADRRANRYGLPVNQVRLSQSRNQTSCQVTRRSWIFHERQNDRELVPAEPCNSIYFPDSRAHSLRSLNKNSISDVVAARVVDLFEPIQIDVENGGAAAV